MRLYVVYVMGLNTTTSTNTNCQYLYFQTSVYCAAIRIFNNLPCILADLMNEKEKSETWLRRYLNTHAVDEIIMFKND
jgi:hypothetical protein